MMFEFTRTKSIGVEKREGGIFLVHGFLDDNVYTIELDIEVKTPELTIFSARGNMKRYTTPECTKAPSILSDAVGIQIGGSDFETKIKKLVGRGGCRHLADLFIECCNAVFPALIQTQWKDAKSKGISKDDFIKGLVNNEPKIRDRCITYSKDSSLIKKLNVSW
ncbi:MAG: DUF2889 domain-containing protein [Thermodesulfobacteriota bacterium]